MRKSVDFKKTVMFWAVTVILAAIATLCISGTVMSKSDMKQEELENYYRMEEQELLGRTKELLTEMGYKNSGVTLTRVVDEDGSREYTFTIHHGKIDKMSDAERAELAKVLAENTEFAGLSLDSIVPELTGVNAALYAECSFYHEFLMYE